MVPFLGYPVYLIRVSKFIDILSCHTSLHRLTFKGKVRSSTYGSYVIFPIMYVQYAYVILPYVDLISWA